MTLLIGGVLIYAAMEGTGGGSTANFIRPVPGKILSGFGPRVAPKAGASTFHNGVDLQAAAGTIIKSPWPGTVIDINVHPTGGNQLIIQHANGYRTGYAHLSGYIVHKIGTHVAAGEAIAYTGQSGNVTGPHLHFTLTNPAGQKIDPAKFL